MLFVEGLRGSHEWRQRHGDLHLHTGKILQIGRKDTGFDLVYHVFIGKAESSISLMWHCALRCRSQSSVSWAGRGRRWRGCVRSSRCCCSDAVTANTDLHRAQCPPQTTSLGTTQTRAKLSFFCNFLRDLCQITGHMYTDLTWTTKKSLTFYFTTMIFKDT